MSGVVGEEWFVYLPTHLVVSSCTNVVDGGVGAHGEEVEAFICPT